MMLKTAGNTNGITLYGGSGKHGSDDCGMIMEFRYCQFGQMALEDGEVTSKTSNSG